MRPLYREESDGWLEERAYIEAERGIEEFNMSQIILKKPIYLNLRLTPLLINKEVYLSPLKFNAKTYEHPCIVSTGKSLGQSSSKFDPLFPDANSGHG